MKPAAKTDGKNGGKSCEELRKEDLEVLVGQTPIRDMTVNLR